MTRITIKVSDLLDMAKEMKKDKMQLVTVTLEEPDDDGGEPLPACLTFHATTSRSCPELVDYGEIDAEPDLLL